MGSRLIAKLLGPWSSSSRACAAEPPLAECPRVRHPVVGDALDAESVAAALERATLSLTVAGTPSPNPSKAREFEQIDFSFDPRSMGDGGESVGVLISST